MKRLGLLISLIMILSLLAACGATPTPEVVEKIVTQEVEVEKQVTQVVPVKETVIVEGTPQVVEVEKVVTATPESKEPVVLRLAIPSDPMTMEPGLFLSLYTSEVGQNVHAGLFSFAEDGSLSPLVAKSYEISDDELTYTFHLRDNVMFHNGRQMVANDFKVGWARYLDPEVQSNAGPIYLGSIVGAQDVIEGNTKDLSGVEAVDDLTLKVTLSEPDPGFLMRLATTVTWVVPAEAVVEGKAEWVDQPVGAGPFKFVEWKTNERIVLEAFDDYFLGRPQIDRIEYYIVPDATTEVAMYEGDELDIAAVPFSDLDRLQADAELGEELNFWTRARMIALIMNYDLVPQFDDIRVRQALAHAINREQLAEAVMRNSVMPAEGLVPPGIPSYDPFLRGAEYDPEMAQQLLAEAGYPGGEGFPALGISAYGANIEASEAVAAMLHTNLGLDVEVNPMERGDMVNAMWALDELPFFMKGWTADFPSAEVWLHQWLRCDVESNFANYCNPEYDAVVDQAMSTSDPEAQIQLWHQAEVMAMDDVAMIPLMYNRYIYLVKPYVQNFRFNFGGPMPLGDVRVEQ
jgi:oligopeptide transport system substrate-binding protein